MNKFGVLLGIVCIFLIHNLDGVYGDGACPSDVIDNLNTQLEDTLSKYPEREASSLALACFYHDTYENLKGAKLSTNAKQYDCDNVEKLLEDFHEIAPDFDNINGRMEKAIDALNIFELDANTSTELKHDALSLKTQIKYSTSIQEAEAALEKYEAFKTEHNIAEH